MPLTADSAESLVRSFSKGASTPGALNAWGFSPHGEYGNSYGEVVGGSRLEATGHDSAKSIYAHQRLLHLESSRSTGGLPSASMIGHAVAKLVSAEIAERFLTRIRAVEVALVELRELRSEVADLRRQAAAVPRGRSAHLAGANVLQIVFPDSIECVRPDEITSYLGSFPDVAGIVLGMSQDLVQEFRDTGARISLAVSDDHDADEKFLTLNVRMPTYAETFIGRLDAVSIPYDEALSRASGWVVVTTDFGVIE